MEGKTFTGKYLLVSTNPNNSGCLTYDRLPELQEPYIGRRSSEGFGYRITKIKEKAAEFTQDGIFANQAIAEKVNSGTLEMWAVYEDSHEEGYILQHLNRQYVKDVVFLKDDVGITWTPEVLSAKVFSKVELSGTPEGRNLLKMVNCGTLAIHFVSSTKKVVVGSKIKDLAVLN